MIEQPQTGDIQIERAGTYLAAIITISCNNTDQNQTHVNARIRIPLAPAPDEPLEALLQRLHDAAPRLLDLEAIRRLCTPQPRDQR